MFKNNQHQCQKLKHVIKFNLFRSTYEISRFVVLALLFRFVWFWSLYQLTVKTNHSSLFNSKKCTLTWKRTYKNLIVAQPAKKFPALLNLNVHYSVHNSLPLHHIPRYVNRAHNLIISSSVIHFNIILSSMPTSPQWSVTLRLPN